MGGVAAHIIYNKDVRNDYWDSLWYYYPISFLNSLNEYNKLLRANIIYTPNLALKPENIIADTIVVVIGESGSSDRWANLRSSLDEKMKNNTTDKLDNINNINITTALSNAGNTVMSLPYLISGLSSIDAVKTKAPTFLDLAKNAGYKTIMLDNSTFFRLSAGEGFFPTAVRRGIDNYIKVGYGSYDGNITNEYIKALNDKAPLKLILIHTYGSHFRVTERYPAEYKLYEDVYDNSIKYTADLLAQWISLLDESQNGNSNKKLFVYTSDHGLGLTPCLSGPTHTAAQRSTYRVPFLLWQNDYLKNNHPDLFDVPPPNNTYKIPAVNSSIFTYSIINAMGYSAANALADNHIKPNYLSSSDFNIKDWINNDKCTIH